MDVKMKRSLKERYARIRKLDPTKVISTSERLKHNITELLEGGFVRYRGKIYCVLQMGVYQELNKSGKPIDTPWYEMRMLCMENGEYVNLEWEEDDPGVIKASITADSGELKLRDIINSEGDPVDPDSDDYDLDDIVDEEDYVTVKGKRFEYSDDYNSLYLREGAEEGLEVYMYEFESNDGECITIEEWKDGDDDYSYEYWRSQEVDPDEFEIISLGG